MLELLLRSHRRAMFLQSCILRFLVLPISLTLAADYFTPNATGIKLQNGFERVYIQVNSLEHSLRSH